MELVEKEPYERKLLDLFQSCEPNGLGLLDYNGLSQLCGLLHLNDQKEELMTALFPNSANPSLHSVSFPKFRDALLKLLSPSYEYSERKPDSSPDRVVTPKLVNGEKKYGRRSRRDSPPPENSHNHNSFILSSSTLPSEYVEKNGEDNPNSYFHNLLKEFSSAGERELRCAWERLGVKSDDHLSRDELGAICSSIGMDDHVSEEVVSHVFSSLKPDQDGRISCDEFFQLFRSRIAESSPSSQFTMYGKYSNILEICDFPVVSHRELLQELQNLKCELEGVLEEREKLRCDLANANRRSTILAQEIDESHSRLENSAALAIQLMEDKHSEEMRELKTELRSEKEMLIASNIKLEESLNHYVEQLSKGNQELARIRDVNESLEKSNEELKKELAERERRSKDIPAQLACIEALQHRVLELEFSNENFKKSLEKMNLLHVENSELRDKNDELTSQIESLISLKSGRCKSFDLAREAHLEALKEENLSLLNRCSELENSLELLRLEYEKTEDYWENKLNDERRLFELDKEQSDEKFLELEAKIQEYADLITCDIGKKSHLPAIEEKDFLEKQFTDLEKEYEMFREASNEEMATKDAEISELKAALAEIQSSASCDKCDADTQTQTWKLAGKLKSYCSSSYKPIVGGGKMHENVESLGKRLRQQEIRCRELQNLFRNQQRETEATLEKAWERHKMDLTKVQNSLRLAQEKLLAQRKTTKQQLERLGTAESLLKELSAENAHLIQSLQGNSQSLSESALHNSF